MIKFRYIFQNMIFKKDFILYDLTLKEIRKGYLNKIMKSGIIENGYRFFSKDKIYE